GSGHRFSSHRNRSSDGRGWPIGYSAPRCCDSDQPCSWACSASFILREGKASPELIKRHIAYAPQIKKLLADKDRWPLFNDGECSFPGIFGCHEAGTVTLFQLIAFIDWHEFGAVHRFFSPAKTEWRFASDQLSHFVGPVLQFPVIVDRVDETEPIG